MSAIKDASIMQENKPKKSIWRTLGKIVTALLPLAIAAAKAGVFRGTGGAILKELDKEKVTEKENTL